MWVINQLILERGSIYVQNGKIKIRNLIKLKLSFRLKIKME